MLNLLDLSRTLPKTLLDLGGSRWILAFGIGVALYVVLLAQFRLINHPLASVPGPKLAALTGWYETYYDCVLSGRYTLKIEEMHKRYGPIVRVNPREVHIDDPLFYNLLYNVQNKLDKDSWYYRFNGDFSSTFATVDAETHQTRRRAVSRYFSPSALTALQFVVQRNIKTLCDRLNLSKVKDDPVNLSDAFRSFTTDTVTQHCLPEGTKFLESADLGHNYHGWVRTFGYMSILNRHLLFLMPTFKMIPFWVVKPVATQGCLESYKLQTVSEEFAMLLLSSLRQKIARQAHAAFHAKGKSARTLLEGIVNADLPELDRTLERAIDETHTFVGAGSETTASTMDQITFHVLSNPVILRRLRNELKDVASHDALNSFEALRQIPYLMAVVNEGLRITSSVAGRLPRVNPRAAMTYGSYHLPPGTVMSMGIRSMHYNPNIYVDPLRFDPDRWLNVGNRQQLDSCLVPFGRGSRACIGKDFATIELVMLTANLFARFELELYNTTAKDIKMEHEFFSAFAAKSSAGILVKVKRELAF